MKTKARAGHKGSSAALAKKLAAKTRPSDETVRPNSSTNHDENPATLKRALAEAYQREAATADVLKFISRSTFDLQTVMDTLVESVGRLCRADRAGIRIAKDGLYHHAASYGYSPELRRFHLEHPLRPTRGTIVGKVALERRTIQVADLLADTEYTYGRAAYEIQQVRTMLAVPMVKDDELIGVISVMRQKVEPFTDKQIELAETFADQAVIAIENARLLDELRQRTDDLTESLEQQTATSEVLQVISSSPGELQQN
jgi:GAF domain-containing protein